MTKQAALIRVAHKAWTEEGRIVTTKRWFIAVQRADGHVEVAIRARPDAMDKLTDKDAAWIGALVGALGCPPSVRDPATQRPVSGMSHYCTTPEALQSFHRNPTQKLRWRWSAAVTNSVPGVHA
jgi:hypothetical protein